MERSIRVGDCVTGLGEWKLCLLASDEFVGSHMRKTRYYAVYYTHQRG